MTWVPGQPLDHGTISRGAHPRDCADGDQDATLARRRAAVVKAVQTLAQSR